MEWTKNGPEAFAGPESFRPAHPRKAQQWTCVSKGLPQGRAFAQGAPFYGRAFA